jgi:hypothetical protein
VFPLSEQAIPSKNVSEERYIEGSRVGTAAGFVQTCCRGCPSFAAMRAADAELSRLPPPDQRKPLPP